jgi:hypothetical protein
MFRSAAAAAVTTGLTSLRLGQRVVVYAAGRTERRVLVGGVIGTVVKLHILSADAWVELDIRSSAPGVHEYGETDKRARWVYVRPADCAEAQARRSA